MLKDYGDKIQLVFKNYPLPNHALAGSAALAGECANAQGKFSAYADKLFATQATWSKLKDATGTFKTYAAQLGLKTADFNKCLDSKQFQSQIDATVAEGQGFGIQGTPALFIGDNFQNGLVKYEDVKKIIDEQLK
jgi:protein-disulfide isomerase